jgi:uncharacterized protein
MERESRIARRAFLGSAVAGGFYLASWTKSATAQAQNAPASTSGSEKWMNEPHQWRREGNSLICTADPKTDFWRKTYYGYITDNGHFFYRSVAGDFTTSVKVTGKYHDLYDQAGLMVRLDKENWMKCGVEFVDGKQNMSVVITRDFSDWSTFRLPEGTGPLWVRVVRKKEALDIFYSLDAKNFAEIRTGYLVPSDSVDVGPAFAAPEGKGFEVRFDDWTVEKNEAK